MSVYGLVSYVHGHIFRHASTYTRGIWVFLCICVCTRGRVHAGFECMRGQRVSNLRKITPKHGFLFFGLPVHIEVGDWLRLHLIVHIPYPRPEPIIASSIRTGCEYASVLSKFWSTKSRDTTTAIARGISPLSAATDVVLAWQESAHQCKCA